MMTLQILEWQNKKKLNIQLMESNKQLQLTYQIIIMYWNVSAINVQRINDKKNLFLTPKNVLWQESFCKFNSMFLSWQEVLYQVQVQTYDKKYCSYLLVPYLNWFLCHIWNLNIYFLRKTNTYHLFENDCFL